MPAVQPTLNASVVCHRPPPMSVHRSDSRPVYAFATTHSINSLNRREFHHDDHVALRAADDPTDILREPWILFDARVRAENHAARRRVLAGPFGRIRLSRDPLVNYGKSDG